MNIIAYKRRRNPLKKKISLKEETQKTVKALVITLGILIVSLSAVFLIINTKNNESGYMLEQEKLRNENLRTTNEDLSTKITKATTSSEISSSGKVGKMAETEAKIYVTEEDNTVK